MTKVDAVVVLDAIIESCALSKEVNEILENIIRAIVKGNWDEGDSCSENDKRGI